VTRSSGKLSDEDRIIWTKVARTAKPLKGKPPLPADEPEAGGSGVMETLLAEASAGPPEVGPKRPERRAARHGPHPFDQLTRYKLAKGRLQIDARVDLHGMTQSEAHGLLLSFLHRAHASGLRHVLVITGKGASFGSEGVLKRAVPVWLSTPPFRTLVGSHDAAARQHGGAGAIYIRLRRRDQPRQP
jgi:DNA-nicking Smr family endonuclease